ncbi:pentapeptide repeat-containing protein [Cupriavidus gilardii]|uniref:pentapeptide repeat-containing protein n=1 Tax=Cupriavidus gilardii TaxID=82541 RepID=UPI0021C20308|nr:pentapeptide repeat-containing protein [Cupriavidus gilardii]MCT9124041.1 pentapeptide repeat-containing protein [Cupriavidus gilardii]
MTIPSIHRGIAAPSAPQQSGATPPASTKPLNAGIQLAVHDVRQPEPSGHDAAPRQRSWQRFLELARRLVGLRAGDAARATSPAAAQRSALLRGLRLEPDDEAPLTALAFDFSHADLAGADPPIAGVSHLRFHGADLRQATLREISLAWTDFSGAQLEGAHITIAAETLARLARPSVLALTLQSIATIDPCHAQLRRALMEQVLGALRQAAALARRDRAMLPAELRALVSVHPLFAGMTGVEAVLERCAPARADRHPAR